ncbi:TetR/AcrR family transcriptional regulator [Arthrobacter crusticola]|uniref:TetR/AcrR family transcriptional regulator n=1 Tax=Arthrobacter crusticola TaxID=2547960 RepID=A0A4R5TMP9_9MICC|nr:TetR/AcrR family transcriptional regulator [Arthrobacter crusticola]TDK23669.1 TetR/AcrR family transcriptional regulator [Arthrobacter crusticola]
METHDGRNVSSREKVLAAAAAMMAENPAANLSVRAVAARAGVSVGSLRFHFPTQDALQGALLTRIYDHFFPEDPIRDPALSARDRLVACLRQILAPTGVGAEARKAWETVYKAFIEPEQTADLRSTYAGIERESLRRVTYWLSIMADEGALPRADLTPQARFLLTVLNGLSYERALPSSESLLQAETTTLYLAADAVLGTGRTGERPETTSASTGQFAGDAGSAP